MATGRPSEVTDPPERPGRKAAPDHFRVRERVRWSDVDAAGIVCYGMYLRFFERAESELFHAVGLSSSTLSDLHNLWLVRRRIECDFLHPVRLDEELEISVAVGAVRRSSLELRFEVSRAGEAEITAAARYVVVAVDRCSLLPLMIPDPIRAALRPFLARPATGAARANLDDRAAGECADENAEAGCRGVSQPSQGLDSDLGKGGW